MRPTAIVADDEPLLRAGLRAALAEAWPELEVVAEAANGAEAVAAVREHQPAFAFLDIEMPRMNGLEAAREIRGMAEVTRLTDTVGRLKVRLGTPAIAIDDIVGELARRIAPSQERLQWLQASLGSTLKLINVDDVFYFQSDTKYTRVVTREGEALVKKTLRELASELDPRHFWQVHRGTIVNIRAIASVSSDDMGRREITLRDRPETIEVSRTFAHLFKSS